jgi:hypothetical protein
VRQATRDEPEAPLRSRLLRLLPDGSLDAGYQARVEASLRRIAALMSPRVPEGMTDFVLRRNGDLVVAGRADRGGWVATLRPDGSLQRQFSGDGLRRFAIEVDYIAPDRHGRLFVLGRESIRWSIFRLLPDGSRDRSVGGPRGQWLPRPSDSSLSSLVSLWHGRPLLYFKNLGSCSSPQDCAEPAELLRLRPPAGSPRR